MTECWENVPTAEQLHAWRLLAFVSGATSSIKAYRAMLAGERPISRMKLLLAQCEDRDHLAELQARLDHFIRKRAAVAESLHDLGYPPVHLEQYRAELHEFNGRGST